MSPSDRLFMAAVAAAAACAAAAGCSHVPYLRRWAKKPVLPYLANPRFSFEYPRNWGRLVEISGGAEVRDEKTGTAFSIRFFQEGEAGYKPVNIYRKEMYDWGAVEDEHIVYELAFSSRAAYRVRYTTYDYDPEYLLGEQVAVLFTEIILVPDPDGIFVLRYQAPKDRFWNGKARRHYEAFLKSIILAVKKVED